MIAASVPSQVSAGARQASQPPQSPGCVLAEMLEQRLPATGNRLAHGEQRFELPPFDALDLFGRLAFVDHPAALHHVGHAVGHERIRRQPVAARAAGLLVVGLDRAGHIEMRHIAHVGLVDAHAEGDGGDEADRVLLEERILVARPDGGRQSRVIGQRRNAVVGQPFRGFFDLVAGQAIDDAALALVALEEAEQLLGPVRALRRWCS